MNKTDARYLRLEVQEYLRQQAIRLRQQGKSLIIIGEYLGVHRNTVASVVEKVRATWRGCLAAVCALDASLGKDVP